MCQHLDLGDGNFAIICGVRRHLRKCRYCSQPEARLCDWKIGGGKTCDAPVCEQHAVPVAPGKDLCLFHARAWESWKAAHPNHPLIAQRELAL